MVYVGTKAIDITDHESLASLRWSKDNTLAVANYDVSLSEGDRDDLTKQVAPRGDHTLAFKMDTVVRIKGGELLRKDAKGRTTAQLGSRIGTLVLGKDVQVTDKDAKGFKKNFIPICTPYIITCTDTSYVVLMGVYSKVAATAAPPTKKKPSTTKAPPAKKKKVSASSKSA